MKEQLYTIPVNDAFQADTECPLCKLYHDLQADSVSFVMGQSYMQDDIRMKTNEVGFCPDHMRLMYSNGNRLGLALMMNTHLDKIIEDMISTMKTQFSKKFKQINKYFNEIFAELFGGGKAELSLENEEDILECGIEIKAQPPGKALKNMMLLSGGEKALTAIAILFAILKINPAPFCILDEIEAALDDVNVNRYAEFLRKFSKETQFLVITHRKGTMEIADSVYGVTMEEKGISKLLSMSLANKRKD